MHLRGLPPVGRVGPRELRRCVVLVAAPLAMTSAGCGSPPRGVVPERAHIELTIRVIDVDPLVVTDCQRSIARALQRRGFQQPDTAVAQATNHLNVRVDVTFPDGSTADITGAVDVTIPQQAVMASSRVGYFDLPVADLRLPGARYRTLACDIAAERFAEAMVDRLGSAPPPIAVPTPEGTASEPAPPRQEEEDL